MIIDIAIIERKKPYFSKKIKTQKKKDEYII